MLAQRPLWLHQFQFQLQTQGTQIVRIYEREILMCQPIGRAGKNRRLKSIAIHRAGQLGTSSCAAGHQSSVAPTAATASVHPSSVRRAYAKDSAAASPWGDEDPSRWFAELGIPIQQRKPVGMGGKSVQRMYRRTHRDFSAGKPYPPRPVDQTQAQRTPRLKSGD